MSDQDMTALLQRVSALQRGGQIGEAIAALEPWLARERSPRLLVRMADLRRREGELDDALPLYREAALAYGAQGSLTHGLAINKLLRLLDPDGASILPGIAQGQMAFLRTAGGTWGIVHEALAELDDAHLQTLLEQADALSFGPGEIVTGGVEDESRTFVVMRGQVRISGRDSEGRVAEQALLSPGDFFDDWSLSQGLHPSWAESITEVDLLVFKVDTVAPMEAGYPRIAAVLRESRQRRALEALLAHQPTLGALDGPTRQRIPELMEEVSLRHGTIIFREGEESDHLYLVQRGRVEVYTEGGDGQRMELAQLGPGNFFGEAAAFQGTPRTASVKARTDVVLYRLGGDALMDLLAPWPGVIEGLKGVFRERVADTLDRLDEADVLP